MNGSRNEALSVVDLDGPTSTSTPADGRPATTAQFNHRGGQVDAVLTPDGLQIQGGIQVPYHEMVAAETALRTNGCTALCCVLRHQLLVHTFQRAKKNEWKLHVVTLSSEDEELVNDWRDEICQRIGQLGHRPRALLVLINPFGGARRASPLWHTSIAPLFALAGIKSTVIETDSINHAHRIVESMQLFELQAYDGIVAVGGDGLFQEVLNGLLAVRSAGRGGHQMAHLRLGHIPAGSTDAAAYSFHGTRSALTAALHIILGDRTPVDVMRVDSAEGRRRFSVCMASYGYMGDLMALSEAVRWMGPVRYDIAGAVTLFRNRSTRLRVCYRETLSQSFSARKVCRTGCELCSGALPSAPAFVKQTDGGAGATGRGGWRCVEGDFQSLMLVLSPCRSDRSGLGVAPFSHIADGLLHLVLVRKCNPAKYLRFLASIPSQGVQADKFEYVHTLDTSAVVIQPTGRKSTWNVDGELFGSGGLHAEVFKGLVDVFARGVE